MFEKMEVILRLEASLAGFFCVNKWKQLFSSLRLAEEILAAEVSSDESSIEEEEEVVTEEEVDAEIVF